MALNLQRLITCLAIASSTPAAAVVLPGVPPCPTMFWPAPCIILDTGRLSKAVGTVTIEARKIAKVATQVQSYVSLGKRLGSGDIAALGLPTLRSLTVTLPNSVPDIVLDTKIRTMQLPEAIEAASKLMVSPIPGTGQPGATAATKEAVVRQTALGAFATRAQSAATVDADERTLKSLTEDAGSAKDLREDFAANSALRLELVRQQAVGAAMMATLLKVRAARKASEQRPVNQLVQWQPTKPTMTLRLGNSAANWTRLLDVEQLANAGVRITQAAQLVGLLRESQQGLAKVVQMAASAQSVVAGAETALQIAAGKAQPRNALAAAQIAIQVRQAMAGLQSLATALNSDPAAQSRALAARGIDAASLIASGVSPAMLIGSYADSAKEADARAAVAQLMAPGGALSRLVPKGQLTAIQDSAAAYHSAILFSDFTKAIAADAAATGARLDTTVTSLEAARGLNLDGDSWEAIVDRITDRAESVAAPLDNATPPIAAAADAAVRRLENAVPN